VAFVIMPLFALCNAGVALDVSALSESVAARVSLGIGLGLLIGKPIGITFFAWLAVRAGLAQLPRGVVAADRGHGLPGRHRFHRRVVRRPACLLDPGHGAAAKVGILLGLCAIVVGVAGLARTLPRVD
jgi:NhaA family Na+:H+ antiporter